MFIYPNLSPGQNVKVEELKKKIIVLESTKKYISYSLLEKEAEVESNQLNEKVGILNNSVAYLEPFLNKNEDLVISLNEKLKVSEKDLSYSSSSLNS